MTDTSSPDEVTLPVRPIRPCPVCASSEQDVLYRQRFENFAAGSITDAYDVVACRQCGMCFASGLPDVARFNEYYGQSSKYDLSADGAEVSSYEVRRHENSAAFIAANVVNRDQPVLDIGTATGTFLLALREVGFASVHGVEPSEEAARKAREVNDLDVIAGDVGTATRKWGPGFALVSFVAVLEHLVDPRAALREIIQLLRSGGVMYLLVPDASRFSDHVDAPYQQFSVEHINYFTLESLANLLTSIGLEVIVDQAMIVKPSADAEGPGIEVLCRRTDRTRGPEMDSKGVEELRRYITRSSEIEARVVQRIADLAEAQSPIYVWGTGTNALHLLAASRLAECNVVAFIDSNPHYSGKQLAGRTVMTPGDVDSVDAPILVASAISQTAIATAARNRFGADVPLILLY